MRSITEEEERTNLALQSANEEILANNEELQSMNEEMHIAREEIQATNNELQKRNTQLGEAYSDLNNLILSLGIASVLVDDGRTSHTPVHACRPKNSQPHTE